MIKIANGSSGAWYFLEKGFVIAHSAEYSKTTYSNSVYEVIRVIGNVPVFIEDHYARFENSLKNYGLKNYPPIEELKDIITKICDKNSIHTGNIRFEMYFDEKSSVFALYQIPHFYPSEEMYLNGVRLVSYKIERPSPNIKQSVVNSEVRSRIATLQDEEKAYEVVLVNHSNEITEGSKSNIFFISGTTLYTAPAKVILEGITRKQLLSLLKITGIKVEEKPISIHTLKDYESCFITGTSPKILPVSSIDSIPFNPMHPLLQNIIVSFNDHIYQYCRNYK